MLAEHFQGLLNLAFESRRRFQQVQQFDIFHFKEHTCDFSSELWLTNLDEWAQTFPNHVLLYVRFSAGELRQGKWTSNMRLSVRRVSRTLAATRLSVVIRQGGGGSWLGLDWREGGRLRTGSLLLRIAMMRHLLLLWGYVFPANNKRPIMLRNELLRLRIIWIVWARLVVSILRHILGLLVRSILRRYNGLHRWRVAGH
jgi:hypothetical protein